MDRQRFIKPFRLLVISLGGAAFLFSIHRLPVAQLDVRFLLLALMTVGISSRVTVQIPRVAGHITVSDTFIFLVVMLYGGEAAILLAALEGVSSALTVCKRPWKLLTLLFNSAVMACSTFLSVWTVRLSFGPILDMSRGEFSASLISAVCVLALVQYVVNSGLMAVDKTFKCDLSLWQTWRKYFLWTSITYFAGASAAGVIAKLIALVGFYSIIATTPIIAIVYLTYRTYLKSVEASTAQAEEAERHVAELNHYVTELERIRKELHESGEHFRNASLHDELTGLPNRTLLTNHLQLAIDSAKRNPNHQFAVLFLDLDRFKMINDSLGHLMGDQVLVMIARRLEKWVRPTDTVARLGGDEFAILLDGIGNFSQAVHIAERVQTELSAPLCLDGPEVYTTVSIGIALSTTGYEHPESILRDADTAMYRAKENGKARYELFDNEMHSRAVALLQLENDLRRALERREFRVCYQPIVSLKTGEISGFEALARWYHPERGVVFPEDFIPIAEETGLIVEIGHWVLGEACRQMRCWQRQALIDPSLTISVNLSGKQFAQPGLVGQVNQVLQETELAPHCLSLEITESAVMEKAEMACAMLTQLRELGIGLSIDDFGTGYSSLSYLHRFPINTLKIDRSFVKALGASHENLEIVRTIITLAANLGKEVIAEGVDTEAQRQQLKALKCEYGQGYLFSEAVAADALEELLLKRTRMPSSTLAYPDTQAQEAHPSLRPAPPVSIEHHRGWP